MYKRTLSLSKIPVILPCFIFSLCSTTLTFRLAIIWHQDCRATWHRLWKYAFYAYADIFKIPFLSSNIVAYIVTNMTAFYIFLEAWIIGGLCTLYIKVCCISWSVGWISILCSHHIYVSKAAPAYVRHWNRCVLSYYCNPIFCQN